MYEHVLRGCAPIPLASYLKALGIFRLVAEQKDKDARGFWRDESFVLRTALSETNLIIFFLDQYAPSPLISPWNGRAGFLEGEDNEDSSRGGAELVRLYQQAKAPKFIALQRTIDALLSMSSLRQLNSLRDRRKKLHAKKKSGQVTDDEIAELGNVANREAALKTNILMELRSDVPDQVVRWMDTCWRIGASEDGAPPAPLLGSGGNDGSRDLGVNFGQQLSALFDFSHTQGEPRPGAQAALKAAIFDAITSGLKREAIGQFAPGQGGPNAGVGFGQEAPLNPWDAVLSLEGSVIFAGSMTRRLGGFGDQASFPFTAGTTGAGGSSAYLTDEGEARGEIWVPLWRQPATYQEVIALFSEGRATLRRLPARDGLDFARAAVTLGFDRGISAFQRYGFLKREGRSYIAAPMGRILVRRNYNANLLNDVDRGAWLRRFRDHARAKNSSARVQSVANRLDEAIFELTRHPAPQSVQEVLAVLGEAIRYTVLSPKARDPKQSGLNPPPRLSRRWFGAANDGTAEFRIAAALAGLGRSPLAHGGLQEQADSLGKVADENSSETVDGVDNGTAEQHSETAEEERVRQIPPPPFRAHLAPLDETSWYGWYRKWSNNDRLAVWGTGGLERNLIAVLERRLLFASQRGLTGHSFEASSPADLANVLTFLAHTTDDAKISALVQGLAWAEPPYFFRTERSEMKPLPLDYAILKPFFAPVQQLRELGVLRESVELSIPTGLVPRLDAGDVGSAMALACRRARASGLPATFEPRAEHVSGINGRRLLAALLIPIRTSDLKRVLERAYPTLFEEDPPKKTQEATDHAA